MKKIYSAPNSSLIQLNMTEDIAASAGPQSKEFFSKIVSDPTGKYVSNSTVLWEDFKNVANSVNSMGVYIGQWLYSILGDVEFRDTLGSCVVPN